MQKSPLTIADISPSLLKNKKLVFFDLDKTLTRSKEPLTPGIARLLAELGKKYSLGIISGGNHTQFYKQVFPFFPDEMQPNFHKVFIMANCGTKFVMYKDRKWDLVFADYIPPKGRKEIIDILNQIVIANGIDKLPTWGDRIEDRETQITLSVLGQKTPIEEKEKWDPTGAKKIELKRQLDPLLPNYQVKTGGSTSIDITKPGRDKGFGVKKLSEYSGYTFDQMLFIGDALHVGGNDRPVFDVGVDSIQTSGPDETVLIIEKILKN